MYPFLDDFSFKSVILNSNYRFSIFPGIHKRRIGVTTFGME